MRICQLKPGDKVVEHKEGGNTIHYEVVCIRQVGKQFEVTFRSALGLASALYPANALISASV